MPRVKHLEAVSLERAVLKTLEGEEITVTEQAPVPCFRCGVCCICYQPPLGSEDIDNIASALGISRSKCISKYTVKVPIREGHLVRRVENGCIFLAWEANGRARCSIYPSRPRACREWIPSLSRAACLEGLTKLKSEGGIMVLEELLQSQGERDKLYKALANSTGIVSSKKIGPRNDTSDASWAKPSYIGG